MKKFLLLLTVLFASIGAQAQYTPPPVAAYTWNGSAWVAAASSGVGQALSYVPPSAGLYCLNGGSWVPADSSCFGTTTPAFSALTSGTNTSAAMVVGSGASLTSSGTGTVTATQAPLNVQFGVVAANPVGGTVLYSGLGGTVSTTIASTAPWVAPRAGTITFVSIGVAVNGTLDTGADNIVLKVYDITTSTAFADTAITLTPQARYQGSTLSATNDSVAAGDKLCIQATMPASFTVSPTSVFFPANILFK